MSVTLYRTHMRQDKAAGIALIAGPLAGLVTMAFHPTGRALLEDFSRVAFINRTVHALAIAGTIITTYGLRRLTRQFARDTFPDAAFVSYAFGAVAVMFAAIASGFIGTDLAAQVLAGGPEARALYEPARDFGWALNQATTRVFVVTASVAIGLWSLAMWREDGWGRALAGTGLVIGVAAVVATIAGMPMDIHGFGAVVLGHGTWLVWTGARMVR
jgi:hypothetical protein